MILDYLFNFIRQSISSIYAFKFGGLVARLLEDSAYSFEFIPKISELCPEVTLLIL